MKMKRWLSCTLALAMLLGLMGCGGTSDEAPNDGSGSSEDEIVINYPTFQIGTNTAAPWWRNCQSLQRRICGPVSH